MLSTNMEAIQTVGLSSDDCGQEDRRVLEELEILMYALELKIVEEKFWKKGIFERASRSLKIFMVRNVSKEEKVEDLRIKLIRKVREEEEEKERAMDLQNLIEM